MHLADETWAISGDVSAWGASLPWCYLDSVPEHRWLAGNRHEMIPRFQGYGELV